MQPVNLSKDLSTDNEPPILLLDDVESELDDERKTVLYSEIEDFSSQVLLTATDISESKLAKFSSLSVLNLKEGKISLNS